MVSKTKLHDENWGKSKQINSIHDHKTCIEQYFRSDKCNWIWHFAAGVTSENIFAFSWARMLISNSLLVFCDFMRYMKMHNHDHNANWNNQSILFLFLFIFFFVTLAYVDPRFFTLHYSISLSLSSSFRFKYCFVFLTNILCEGK